MAQADNLLKGLMFSELSIWETIGLIDSLKAFDDKKSRLPKRGKRFKQGLRG